jgi:hypothetical protein
VQHVRVDGVDALLRRAPRQDQLSEHLIAARRPVKAQLVLGPRQGIPQVARPRRGDRQRPGARTAPGRLGGLQAQVKLALPRRQPLASCGLQQLQQFVEPVVAMADDFKGRAGQATRGACVSAAERGLQVIATGRTAATRARRS